MNFDSAVFYTNDLGKVLDFYKDILGITLEFKDEERYLSFIFPNGARLGIKRKTTDREIPGAQTVIFSVEKDIEKLFDDLKNKVPVYKELLTYEWGKNFSILDPDGNKVEFIQR
ncbi:MAG TPA: VOC family protein [Candidatus Paceibacterota bacterium]